MKVKNLFLYIMMVALASFGTACSEEEFVDNPSGEVFIYRLNVVNAGLSGTEVVEGELNEETKTVDFTIPAESDVQALKFSGKLSLGAKLDAETYDVMSGSATVNVLNGENIGKYTVKVALNAPVQNPLLSKVTVKDETGEIREAFVSELDKTVYLKCVNSLQAEIVSIDCLPRRTVTALTNGEGNIVKADNPGKIQMDFMGLKNEYRISFDNNPVFGADFSLGKVYDYTNITGSLWADFAAENTRSADFDGENMLIVSRQGGVFPKIISFASIKAGSPSETVLNTTGIKGGTYLVSAGRLSHKHIFISNLKTKKGENLKIYHWASPNATPEVVVDFDGIATNADLSAARFGDNLSVCLNEAGNGYIFLLSQNGDMILRFDVSGFTNVTNPKLITPEVTAPYYASINQVGNGNEYLYTSTQAPLMLIDSNGTPLFKLDIAAVPIQATDARIITYDAERYLIMTTGRRPSWSKDPDNEFLVYDISDGSNTLIALGNFANREEHIPVYSYKLGGTGASACAANTGWGVDENGNLLVMTAAIKAGFAICEFPEKQ